MATVGRLVPILRVRGTWSWFRVTRHSRLGPELLGPAAEICWGQPPFHVGDLLAGTGYGPQKPDCGSWGRSGPWLATYEAPEI